jgi:hypothetical protein
MPPRGLSAHGAALETNAVGSHRTKERPVEVSLNPGSPDVVEHRASGIKQNLSGLLAPFLSDVEIMLNSVKLKVTDAGTNQGRDAAAGDEKCLEERQVPKALQRIAWNGLKKHHGLLASQSRCCVFGDWRSLHRLKLLGHLPRNKSLLGKLPVDATKDGQPPCNGRRAKTSFQHRSLVEPDMIGSDFERIDTKLSHVLHEV